MLLAILLVCSIPGESTKGAQEVDLIELNHFYSFSGGEYRHGFDQYIFYVWSHDDGRMHVVDYVLTRGKSIVRRRTGKGYVLQWGVKDRFIVVSRHFSETWTDVDPERQNKAVLLAKYRLGLKSVKSCFKRD